MRRQKKRHPRLRRPKAKKCEVSGKLGYESREDAVTAAAVFSRKTRFHGQSFYRCQFCERWHATSA